MVHERETGGRAGEPEADPKEVAGESIADDALKRRGTQSSEEEVEEDKPDSKSSD